MSRVETVSGPADGAVPEVRGVQRATAWLPLVGFGFVALGLIATAVLRYSSGIFYGELGVRPEDVGVAVPNLLAQGLLGLVNVFPIPALILTELVFLGRLGLRQLDEVRFRRGRRWQRALLRLSAGAVFGVTYVVVSAAWFFAVISSAPFTFYLLIVMSIGAVVLVAGFRSGRWFNAEDAALIRKVFSPRWMAGVAAAAFVVAMAITIAVAYWGASRAADGKVVEERPLLPWGALLARVNWMESGTVANPCALYLGESGGTTFLYAREAGRSVTYRYPTPRVRVRIYPDAASCDQLPKIP